MKDLYSEMVIFKVGNIDIIFLFKMYPYRVYLKEIIFEIIT